MLEAKDTKNPRTRTALLRTDTLEAKDRNLQAKAKNQGPGLDPFLFCRFQIQIQIHLL